jgi:uncharacterized protein with gpF-like domain
LCTNLNTKNIIKTQQLFRKLDIELSNLYQLTNNQNVTKLINTAQGFLLRLQTVFYRDIEIKNLQSVQQLFLSLLPNLQIDSQIQQNQLEEFCVVQFIFNQNNFAFTTSDNMQIINHKIIQKNLIQFLQTSQINQEKFMNNTTISIKHCVQQNSKLYKYYKIINGLLQFTWIFNIFSL